VWRNRKSTNCTHLHPTARPGLSGGRRCSPNPTVRKQEGVWGQVRKEGKGLGEKKKSPYLSPGAYHGSQPRIGANSHYCHTRRERNRQKKTILLRGGKSRGGKASEVRWVSIKQREKKSGELRGEILSTEEKRRRRKLGGKREPFRYPSFDEMSAEERYFHL